ARGSRFVRSWTRWFASLTNDHPSRGLLGARGIPRSSWRRRIERAVVSDGVRNSPAWTRSSARPGSGIADTPTAFAIATDQRAGPLCKPAPGAVNPLSDRHYTPPRSAPDGPRPGAGGRSSRDEGNREDRAPRKRGRTPASPARREAASPSHRDHHGRQRPL